MYTPCVWHIQNRLQIDCIRKQNVFWMTMWKFSLRKSEQMEKQIFLKVTTMHGLNTVQELDICIIFTCECILEGILIVRIII